VFVWTVQAVKTRLDVTAQLSVSLHHGSVMVIMTVETGLMKSTAVSAACNIILHTSTSSRPVIY